SPVGKGVVSGVQCQFDIRAVGTWHLTEHLAVHRADVVHIAAVDRLYPIAPDVVLILVFKADDRAALARICVDHGRSPYSCVTRACGRFATSGGVVQGYPMCSDQGSLV